MSDKDERAARLAAQLRANLHRRKAQARAAARPDPGAEPPDADGRSGDAAETDRP